MNNKKSEVVIFRATADERGTLEVLANETGLSISETIRELVRVEVQKRGIATAFSGSGRQARTGKPVNEFQAHV